MKQSIAVAKGDGIGPEIMDAVIHIFKGLNIPIEYHYIEMGRDIFLKGHKLGMTPQAKDTVEKLGILFKGPMETPKGGGNKSINVTARKMWSTFANCRRFKYLPGVETLFSKNNIFTDLTIIRENLEDTYGGVEHLLTPDLGISRRFISAPGSYQIHKYAFEYAKQQGLKSVVCGHKANIMKITDGLFLEIFYEVAKDYPDIQASDVIVDDLCMKLVTAPDRYRVIVLPNLQGDIVSDLCAGLVGGLGFAPSANVGSNISIFEAVHGTAPDITGKNLANPTALLLSGLMMLNFLGFSKEAKKIELALLETLQDKIHTIDLKITPNHVSTKEYADAILNRALKISDSDPRLHHTASNHNIMMGGEKNNTDQPILLSYKKAASKCVGVDIFLESTHYPKEIGDSITKLISMHSSNFKLEAISNRGTTVYPESSKFTECVDNYVARFLGQNVDEKNIDEKDALNLAILLAAHYKVLSVEMLKEYDGKPGYSVM
jgi:isocitrate dehydrogenase